MLIRISPFIALVLLASIAAAFAMGLIAANNAFFLAAAVGIVATGLQFASRAPSSFKDALKAILIKPSTYRGQTASYVAYLSVAVLAFALSANLVVVA
ncbi:MAG: hypothetical protein ACPG06_07915 [Alphaproteobacteria bacterium]